MAIIGSSLLAMVVGPARLLVSGDNAATLENIESHPTLFRLGVAYDLAMYAAVVGLAVALYVTLKPVGKHLALLALLYRVGEAILGALSVLLGLLVLRLLGGELDESVTAALVALFLDGREALTRIVLFS